MIYTLTLNPSIDYVVELDQFSSGITNRSNHEEYYVGGKGINVSYILSQLKTESTALGFIAGFTGNEIEHRLGDMGICSDFIRLKNGISRINIKLRAGEESEINCQGPSPDDEEISLLMEKIDRISDGDTLILAGSVPKTTSADIYEIILGRVADKNIRTVVDAAGQLLLSCLHCRPFLIKPNRQELSELFCRDVRTEQETEECARELMYLGAQNVIVSLGADGAVLFADNGKTYHSGVLHDRVIGTVGSGDSMVAGFVAGYQQQQDYEYALKLGTACANATAFSNGLASREKIDEIFNRL